MKKSLTMVKIVYGAALVAGPPSQDAMSLSWDKSAAAAKNVAGAEMLSTTTTMGAGAG